MTCESLVTLLTYSYSQVIEQLMYLLSDFGQVSGLDEIIRISFHLLNWFWLLRALLCVKSRSFRFKSEG